MIIEDYKSQFLLDIWVFKLLSEVVNIYNTGMILNIFESTDTNTDNKKQKIIFNTLKKMET